MSKRSQFIADYLREEQEALKARGECLDYIEKTRDELRATAKKFHAAVEGYTSMYGGKKEVIDLFELARWENIVAFPPTPRYLKDIGKEAERIQQEEPNA